MTWCFETLRYVTAEWFDLEKDYIGCGTVLFEMGIDPDEFVEFLLTLEEDIARDSMYELKDECKLHLEVRDDKSMAYLVDHVVQ